MSLFGKILAIFNVLAVVGTLALMAMSYAKRQSWEYAVFRQDLMIKGLPIDEKETDGQQQPIGDKIGEKTQQDLFKQASPNEKVPTQKKELERVQRQLRTQYQSAGDKKQQIAALARILAPMADTFDQREWMIAYQTHLRDAKSFAALVQRFKDADAAVVKRAKAAPAKSYDEAFHDAIAAIFTDPPGPLAEAFLAAKKANAAATVEQALEQSLDAQLTQLQGQFDQMFTSALVGAEKETTTDHKRRIARLLFNMVEAQAPAGDAKPDLNSPAYKRFFIVVGVKAALDAINEQAAILQELAFATETERMRQLSLFAVEHRKMVDLVRDKKAEVDHHQLSLTQKKKEREIHLGLLKQRMKDVEFYEEQLATRREETTKHLQDLRKLSKALFKERTELRDNTEANQKLEKDIRELEEGR